jgi:hypothetical protein
MLQDLQKQTRPANILTYARTSTIWHADFTGSAGQCSDHHQQQLIQFTRRRRIKPGAQLQWRWAAV